jgi:RNA polymerase sigma factor (sigma-70 family)
LQLQVHTRALEASALTHVGTAGFRGPTPLLRLQSDERLIALVRRGNHAAFEALVGRYQARLLAFCRHMLGSREDAEDVLQEVFAAAFNAILADGRPINARPWLYRIARNRSLNHLRRHTAIGVDSMDIHVADAGQTTAEKVHEREEFRALIGDVQELPETQRTALLLREIDALSYEQIAEAMETTVPSVKSLLVRARVSLAEMAEERHLSCDAVREELGEVAEGLRRTSPPVRRHLRRCDRCANFRKQLRDTNKALASVMPVGPLLLLKKVVLAHLGTTASAGSAATATAAAGSAAGAAGGAGVLSAGVTTVASKAAAGIAAAAIVSVGAVEVKRANVSAPHPSAHAAVNPAPAPAPVPVAAPQVSPAEVEARAAAEARRQAALLRQREQVAEAAARAKALKAKAAAAEKDEKTEGAAEAKTDQPPVKPGEQAPVMPTGPAEQGVDNAVLPGEQQAGPGTGGTQAPAEEEPITAAGNEEPADGSEQSAPPQQQPQPEQQPSGQPQQQPSGQPQQQPSGQQEAPVPGVPLPGILPLP